MNKKPIELHIVDGTKATNKDGVTLLPERLRKRIPEAEWISNPDAWDRSRFIEETADYLYDVYNIGSDQDRHVLAMLADNIDTYVLCMKALREQGLVSDFNDGKTVGPNPHVSIRNKALTLIVQLMNELGLTPRGRLASPKASEESSVTKFLKGPKG
jgi:P27 family predicted phage terminase small subunit